MFEEVCMYNPSNRISSLSSLKEGLTILQDLSRVHSRHLTIHKQAPHPQSRGLSTDIPVYFLKQNTDCLLVILNVWKNWMEWNWIRRKENDSSSHDLYLYFLVYWWEEEILRLWEQSWGDDHSLINRVVRWRSGTEQLSKDYIREWNSGYPSHRSLRMLTCFISEMLQLNEQSFVYCTYVTSEISKDCSENTRSWEVSKKDTRIIILDLEWIVIEIILCRKVYNSILTSTHTLFDLII